MQYQGIEEQRIVNTGLLPIARDLGLPLVVHQRRALPASARRQAARHAAVHRHRQVGQRREAPEVPRRPVLPEDRRADGRGVRRLSRGAAQHAGRSPSAATSRSRSGTHHLPNFDVPDGLHARRLLRARRRARALPSACRGCGSWPTEGKLRHALDEYATRLDYEIAMIKRMGYTGYFMIVWDFIRYAREQGIPVGPGPRLGGRQPRGLLPAHHRRRSDRLRPAVRALPEPRARVAARYRRRLLRAPARRGHRVRHAASTAARTSRRSSPSAR